MVGSKFEIFQSTDNEIELKVQFDVNTVWLNQKQLSELFDKERSVIFKHINNVFEEEELDAKVVCANFAYTTQHGALATRPLQLSHFL